MNALIAKFKAEPAVVIGTAAALLVGAATQLLTSGLVTSDANVNLLHTIIVATPIVAGFIIRNFVSPAA